MIIDDIDEAKDEIMEAEEDVIGTAYGDSIRSVDGFSRGPGGRVKFNKDTKKRRREELEDEIQDVEMGDVTINTNGKSKKRTPEKLGKEFRSKVRISRHAYDMMTCMADLPIESGRRRQEGQNGSVRICHASASCQEEGWENHK